MPFLLFWKSISSRSDVPFSEHSSLALSGKGTLFWAPQLSLDSELPGLGDCQFLFYGFGQRLAQMQQLDGVPPPHPIPATAGSSCCSQAWSGKVKVLGTHSCPTLLPPHDCSLPGSSVHGLLQTEIREWVTIPFSRGSSQARDQTWVSCMAGRFFTIWATSKGRLCTVGKGSNIRARWERWEGTHQMNNGWGALSERETTHNTEKGKGRIVCLSQIKR